MILSKHSSGKFLLLIFIVFLAFPINSCSKKDKSNQEQTNQTNQQEDKAEAPDEKKKNKGTTYGGDHLNPKGFTYELKEMKLQDNASIIDYDEMEQVIDRSEFTYTFGSKAKSIKKVKEGDVIVLSGERIGKVTKIETSATQTEVTLARARLNEAFENLEYEYKYDIDWKSLPELAGTAYQRPLLAFAGEDIGPDGLGELRTGVAHKVTFKKNGYECEVELKAATQDKLEFKVEAKKGAEGGGGTIKSNLQVAIKVEGFVERFDHTSGVRIYNSELEDFKYKDDYKGELEISFVGVGKGSETFKLSSDIPLAVLPAFIGPIPVVTTINAVINIRPILHYGGSSRAAYKIGFDTKNGFEYTDGGLKNISDKDPPVTFSIPGETVSAGTVTVGMGGGVRFPQMKMNIAGETVVGHVFAAWDGSTFYEPGIKSAQKACQGGKSQAEVQMGVSFDFLGVIGYAQEYSLWKKEKKFGNCPD